MKAGRGQEIQAAEEGSEKMKGLRAAQVVALRANTLGMRGIYRGYPFIHMYMYRMHTVQ